VTLRFGRLALVGLGLWLQACGAAVPPPAATSPEPAAKQRPLTELDALQHDFDVSEQQLTAQLERRQSEVASGPALGEAGGEKKAQEGADKDRAAASNASRPAPPPPPAAEQKPTTTRAPEADYSPIGAPCDLMCRALSSMMRSADGICGIAGESDSRCVSARLRVKLATEKVSQAGCACSG
jgi:hypothetical protein